MASFQEPQARNGPKRTRQRYGITDIKSYNAQQDLMLDVQNGRVEGGAGELAGFQYAMTKMPGLKLTRSDPNRRALRDDGAEEFEAAA